VARYSFVSTATRIFVLLLLVIILTIGGLLWLNYLGVINARSVINPVLRAVGLQKNPEIVNLDDPLLLDKQRMEKSSEELKIQSEALEKRDKELIAEKAVIDQRAADLEEKEKDLADRENSFNEKQKAFENRRVNLEQNARYLTGMKPQEAVPILDKMDETDVIDLFRIVEEQAKAEGRTSIIAFWLDLMKEDRAATLVRKMAKRLSDQ